MPQLHGGLIGGSKYQITNSVRLRASASAYFSRTFGAGGDRDKWWILIPFKRSTLGAAQYLFGADTASADAVYFNSSDKLCVDIAGTNRLISTRVFRDPSVWGAFLVVFDASNGTNDLKLRVYYIDNGFAEITAWGTNTRSGITAGTSKTTLNTAAAVIGKNPTAANSYFDGYLSHFHIGTWSGSQPTPASFGGTDSNGVWVFSGASSAYGTQGSWFDFKDANLTAGSNVGLGKDVSGNGNYWTTNNISVTAGVTYDSMVDTPTNNYATLNPIIPSAANISYAALRSGTTAVQGTMEAAVFAGAYWEVTAAGSAVTAGVISGTGTTNTTTVTANKVFGFRLTSGGALDYINITDAGSWTSITTGLSAQQFPYGITQAADWNFGQRPFIGTASGKALCTANLPSVAIPNPSSGYNTVTTTAANIDASTTALRSGWPAYVDIKKNRSNTASWQWQFSHDSTKEYAISASTVTNQAKSSNSGANTWVGHTIRIDAAYGTAAGSVSHTNGSDTTVTHNVGVSARQMIFLFPRAGGTVVRVYHPDLTAGSLLDLCSTAAEAASVTIKTVTSNSFKIDTGTATGTYDYLVLSEIRGFFELGKFTGANAADNSFIFSALRPKTTILKDKAAQRWTVHNACNETYNPLTLLLSFDNSSAEGAVATTFDYVANGMKLRNNYTLAENYVYAFWAEFPIGGSNVSPAPAR